MSVGCKIITNYKRADKKLVSLFEGMPVANIDDNMGRIAAIDSSIVQISKGQLLGTAFNAMILARMFDLYLFLYLILIFIFTDT